MLRINLLPTYVSQRRLTRKVLLGFTALLLLSLLVPLGLYVSTRSARAAEENQATAAEAGKAKTDALKTQATAQRAQIAPIKVKVDFVKANRDYTTSLVAFWATVARYSDPRVIYTDASVSGTTLTIKAYMPSIGEVGRYLQAMYQEPDFTTVSIDKLPGYPDALVTKYFLDNKLIGIGQAPASGAGATNTPGQTSQSFAPPTLGGGTRNGSGSFGGNSPGGGAQSGGSGKTSYGKVLTPGATGTGASANGGSFGDVPVSVTQVIESRIPPFASPEQRADYYQRAFLRIRKKTYPKGFEITVTATLKQPLTAPAIPGSSGATSTPGGYPGGPPGGLPGSLPGSQNSG